MISAKKTAKMQRLIILKQLGKILGVRIYPILRYLNSFMRIRDPGWKQFGSGMEKSRIRDPAPESGSGIRIRNPDPR